MTAPADCWSVFSGSRDAETLSSIMEKTNTSIAPSDYKKLSSQRWLIWTVASLAHTIGMFHRAAMAPIADRVMADFDITAVAFGSLGAAYFYVYALMQLPSGTLADTLGPRKTITAGLLLSAIGSTLMGVSQSFTVLYIGRLIISFGVSVVWLSVVRLIMEWFRPRESGTAVGFGATLSNLGQLAATTPLALLVIWIGWRFSLVTIGQVSLLLAIVNWFIIKDSPAQVKLRHVSQLDEGHGEEDTVLTPIHHINMVDRFKMVFGNRHLWPLFLMAFGLYGAFATFIQNWIVIYLMQIYSFTRDVAANFALVAAVSHVIGPGFSGVLSDKLLKQRRLPVMLFTGTLLVSFLSLTFWNGGKPPVPSLYIICFVMGLGTGAIPIMFASVRELVYPSVRGISSGLVNMGLFVGAAIIQPLFGYILDMNWQGEMIGNVRQYPLHAFQYGLILCCILAMIGFIGALLMKETHCRETYDT